MTANVPFEGLTAHQKKAALALVQGEPTAQVAAAGKVTMRTLRRWQRQPAFRAAIHAASRDSYDLSTARLRALAARAVTVLRSGLDGEAGPVQIRSASLVLEYSAQLALTEIEERLVALERGAGR